MLRNVSLNQVSQLVTIVTGGVTSVTGCDTRYFDEPGLSSFGIGIYRNEPAQQWIAAVIQAANDGDVFVCYVGHNYASRVPLHTAGAILWESSKPTFQTVPNVPHG